jgi:hypothetical protein
MRSRPGSTSRFFLRLPRLAWLSASCVVSAACDSHANVQVELRGDDCMSCHADELETTKQPPHALVNFDDDCGSCHDQRAWSPAPGFAHAQAFPLTFAHEDPSCKACHGAGYKAEAIERDCVDCHGELAREVENPVHAGLTNDCFACHRTDSFMPARFVHSWPLNGVHKTTDCRACHVGNPATYEGTSTRCVSCHDDDRLRVDAMSVQHAGFPSACEGCHSAETWVVP